MLTKVSYHFKLIVSVLAIVLGLVLLVFQPASLSPEESKAAALVIVVISFWATGILPEYLTALFFFLFAMLFSISPPQVVFSGFEATALWLIFGGIVIGVGITNTGLGNRIASKVVVHLEGSYFKLITGLVVLGILFAILMPSPMGRMVLLVPIALNISNYFGFQKGSNGHRGIILAVMMGTVIPAFAILPANAVNMILAGMAETQFKIPILYGDYLFLHFPVLGLLKAGVLIGLILWLYPDRPKKSSTAELISSGPASQKEILLLIIIITLLALWMTDFIHKISPAWISLGGALLLLLPGINIVNSQQFNKEINFESLFYIAGILGLGGMVSHSGLGDELANRLITSLPLSKDNPFFNYILLSTSYSLTGIITTLPGLPAVMTPISDSLSLASGLPLKTVIMIQVVGFSTTFFPFQIPSIVIGTHLAGENLSMSAKFFLVLAFVTFIFLLPINYFWWKAIGWI